MVGWGGLDVLNIVSSLFYRPNLNAQMDRWGLIDSGFDYNLVAVFGSQSTGKSSWLRVLKLLIAYSCYAHISRS